MRLIFRRAELGRRSPQASVLNLSQDLYCQFGQAASQTNDELYFQELATSSERTDQPLLYPTAA